MWRASPLISVRISWCATQPVSKGCSAGHMAHAEERREDVVRPRDLEARVDDDEGGVGMVQDRGELLPLPLEDADLRVERAEPPLVVLDLVAERGDRFVAIRADR